MIQPNPKQQLEQAKTEQQPKHISRRNVLKAGMITAGALTLSGTADAMSIASPALNGSNWIGATADIMGRDAPSKSNATPETLIMQLNAVYVATRKYRDVSTAREEGYTVAHVVPNVGHIFANPTLVACDEIIITKPEALIYVATNGTGTPEDADLDLAAAEYVVPGDHSTNPPNLFADETAAHQLTVTEEEGWHYNERFGVTGFHAWVHFWNIAGLFNLTNPAVTAEGTLKGLTDR
jgi:hypothetical protein